MGVDAWLRRFSDQLNGWHVWYSSSNGRGWYAVPAPANVDHAAALALPGRVGPHRTPQALRCVARSFYSWHDTCDNCGVLARECGHGSHEAAPDGLTWEAEAA